MDIVRNGAIKKRSRLQDDEMMQAKYLDIGKAQGSCKGQIQLKAVRQYLIE